MENNGSIMLSSHYSVYDYLDLDLNDNSDEYKWNKAINIIDERFNERFFEIITFLSNGEKSKLSPERRIALNGFAIMALICLLIDTFYQFENGVENTNRINQTAYTSFLEDHFPDLFVKNSTPNLALIFYHRIRCGILHSAQTYGLSSLTFDEFDTISPCYDTEGRPGIKVNVKNFSKRLKDYFDYDYMKRLRDGDPQTRVNFRKKMEYVCSLNNPERP